MYRLLLFLLPSRFRRDFGAELEAVLVERLRDAGGAGVSAVLLGVALLASWLPARRAARTDPMEVLRAQ